jgi:ATP-binding cassette subfamily F protein uup
LKYAERAELDALPARIETLEKDLASLHQTMADPAFYQQDRLAIVEAKARLEELEQQLRDVYARWEHLESLAEG